mmetsp:Transcript_73834/g.139510  ORF Transcript_73834/g.139510 Transcript_73834/m.139510 type:complete len:254 (+) Transcript_73834:2078-2839(+)
MVRGLAVLDAAEAGGGTGGRRVQKHVGRGSGGVRGLGKTLGGKPAEGQSCLCADAAFDAGVLLDPRLPPPGKGTLVLLHLFGIHRVCGAARHRHGRARDHLRGHAGDPDRGDGVNHLGGRDLRARLAEFRDCGAPGARGHGGELEHRLQHLRRVRRAADSVAHLQHRPPGLGLQTARVGGRGREHVHQSDCASGDGRVDCRCHRVLRLENDADSGRGHVSHVLLLCSHGTAHDTSRRLRIPEMLMSGGCELVV